MAIFTRDKSFYRSLIMLALPISFQQLITFAIGFSDNLMVGRLGDYAISGVYMGNQIQTLLQLVLGGISAAMGILCAQYWGRRDTDSIKTIIAIGTRIALLLGVIMTAVTLLFPHQLLGLFTPDKNVIAEGVPYLLIVSCSYLFFCISQALIATMRSVENPKIGMIVSVIALVTNVSLNWVLIFGHFGFPALGVRGAAIATLVTRILEAIVMVIYVLRLDQKLRLKLRDFLRHDRLLFRDFLRYGMPVICGDIVWSINTLAQSAILGQFQAEAITAASIAGMLHNLTYIWITGLWSAVGIITGKTVGAGLFDKMKEYAKTTQVLFLLIGLVTGGIVFLIKGPFLSLYDISDGAAVIANQMMSIIGISIIGSAYQATCLGGLVKAGGDTSFVFKNDTIFVFGVVLPSALIAMALGAPPWVVFACLKSDQILKCFVAVVKINSFNWMKNLTRSAEEPSGETV